MQAAVGPTTTDEPRKAYSYRGNPEVRIRGEHTSGSNGFGVVGSHMILARGNAGCLYRTGVLAIFHGGGNA